MSKFTISAVLGVLRVVIGITSRAIRLIYAILDLVDDGCLNSSAPRPEWYKTLYAALNTFESLSSHLNVVQDEVGKE